MQHPNINQYKELAESSIQQVFVREFRNSLGIPLPKVKMLMPDEVSFSTGEYYITIDDTWQIHLNFGKLPISYLEFQEEVKVLTRHEIGHYMCCPYDVITHLRMLSKIIETYRKSYSHLNIDIKGLCGLLSNQIADIIVDTNNYIRYPKETLKSEIAWIKKGANIQSCQRHQKLMFLTKEALWGKSLEINETDEYLITKVNELAEKFLEGGISNKKLFLKKTQAYIETFFEIFENDVENSSNHSGKCNDGEGKNGTQDNSSPLNGKPKDGNSNDGAAIMFGSPDNVQDALEQFAQESSLDDFSNVLSIAGIKNLSQKDKEKMWFKVNSAVMIPIQEYDEHGANDSYLYPSTWRLGDPVEDMDLMLTFLGSPKMLPGITTKKWEFSYNERGGNELKPMDLFLVFDTSGSMGNISNEKSNMHQCALTCFGIISYFEMIKGHIATLGFSDHISVHNEWTDNYDLIRDSILINGHGSTRFPISAIRNTIESSSNSMVTVLITDGDIQNIGDMDAFFRDYLNDGNKLYILILKDGTLHSAYNALKSFGAQIWQSKTAEGFGRFVIDDIST